MDLALGGKTALVGGATKGLGYAIARELLREGCTVGICSRSQQNVDTAVQELSVYGQVWGQAADLSRTEQAVQFVQAGIERQGRVDIVVTNAGGPPAGPFMGFDEEDWLEAFRLNTLSAVTLIRTALPGMIERGWGRIITITSISVKQPPDGLVLSNGARLAVAGVVKTLSREVARHGVTVNNVCPGYTQTERIDTLAECIARDKGICPDDVKRGWAAEIPAGRIGRAEELAAVVAFLASERASYVTGISLQVDGGYVRGMG